jgi:hypothetical protein
MPKKIPYRPACDDRVLVPECSGPKTERIYLRDLARFLNMHAAPLMRFAKQHRLSTGVGHVSYCSPHAAARLIAYFRARQGYMYAAGRDHHRDRERRRGKQKRRPG